MSELTAIETAKAIAAGEMSALEACDAAIARIEARDGPINAVVIRDFERARAAAVEADKAIAVGERKPLLGVPMTIKESFDIGGLPSSWGFPEHADNIAKQDGLTVRQLKAAGAIFLGKTNVPVALADWQSFNPNYGRTRNPHDLTRSPGGSSGGSAAALASGMIPLEYGSDIGGSIRVPAHFCGVWGLKTTFGAVSIEGHPFPRTDSAKVDLSVVGPLARDPQDLALALDLTSKFALPRARFDSLKGVRVLMLTSHPLAAADSEIVAGVERAGQAAAAAGGIVETDTAILPDLAQLHADYWKMLMIVLSRGIAPAGQTPVSLAEWYDIIDLQARYQRHWDRVFQQYDAIFCPVIGAPAFPHTDDPGFAARTLMIDGADSPFAPQFAWISMATYGGMPALSMPIGSMANGLPFNLQLITRSHSDRDAIQLGALLAGAMA